MKKSVLILMSMLLVGCDDLSGTLQINQTLTLKDKKGKQISIQPGVIQAALDYDEEDDGREIELKWKDAAGKKREVKFLVPGNVHIPPREGKFELTAAQSGQAYDLVGEVFTDTDVRGPYNGTEHCTVYVRDYVCRDVKVGHDHHGRPIYRRECRYENVARSGRREISYRETTTTVSAKADIIDGIRGAIASFDGANTQTVRSTDWSGPCYLF